MRYKRTNTLALDLTVLPRFPGVQWIQTIMGQVVSPEQLKCVQLHSSKKTLYVGLQDNVSAADVAKINSRKVITMTDGTKIPFPIVHVDEDVVDVRVRDVPPEIPNDIIEQALRQHGEVRAVSNETWKNFFVGLPTGGRIVRMKIEKNIPSLLKIGNSLARINYPGQTETCKCGLPSHRGHPCREARARQQAPIEPAHPEASSESSNSNTQQIAPANSASPGSSSASAAAGETKAADMMDADDDAASTPFTLFTRKRSKTAKKIDPGDDSDSSSAELENSILVKMNEKQAYKLGPANFEKWLALKSGSKIKIIAKKQ